MGNVSFKGGTSVKEVVNIPANSEQGFKYDQEEKQTETMVYTLAIVVWLAIVVLLGLARMDLILLVLVMIPVVVFVSFILNKNCYYSSSNSTVTGEFLYIILTIFLAWVLVSSPEKIELVRILFLSLGLYIISLFDFKICSPVVYDASIIAFESMSITLILIVVYLYFKESYTGSLSSTPQPL
ncbi:Transmembrane domain-containing protein [Brazilian cedratvirus IHUMI]|uniref:Transmembrane domain-containing protein n=1 Tax=Brazilian cedratvirus IHUMI TaxID=2126980 RepID=A0A2R8FE41_9VIRU|nr:Transmembrane domain-containing protein [Brazilian cedratvirus IHUMI]